MKKLLAMLTALVMILSCAACLAEGSAEKALTLDEAVDLYDEYTGRIIEPEDEIKYQIGTTEYGLLDPMDVDPKEYIDSLRKAKIVEADIKEAPEGE